MITLALWLAVAQVAPDGTITGQVVDGATLKPIAAAVVSIGGASLLGVPTTNRPPSVVTSADGRFVFTGLAPGSYAVTATKGGYAEGEPGRRRPGGDAPAIEIAASRPAINVVVPMWRYSAIAGTVVDEAGDPIVNLQVRALRRLPGTRRYVSPQVTFTDDRGAYRFGGLLPGDYLVVASPAVEAPGRGNGTGTPALTAIRPSLYPPTFYPAAASPALAQPIALASGEERPGIDIRLALTRAARVSGVVLKDGAAVAAATVSLVPPDAETTPSSIVGPSTTTDAEGRFVFAAVVPGRYTLRASGGRGTRGWIRLPLTVTADGADGIVAIMNAALKITARTQFEGTSAPPRLGSTSFTAMPFALEPADGVIDGVSLAGSIGPNGVVSTEGFMPGRYRVRVLDAPSGWMLKGAMLNGADVADTPFEFTKDVPDLVLVYTDRISRVTGRVDAGATDASVLLFTSDATVWADASPPSRRFRQARVSGSGEFTFDSVPPGDYYVIAVPASRADDWRDPVALDALAAGATRLSVAEGETRTLVLRLVKDARR